MENSDYRIRCHRSRGDSGQREAERTNSANGDVGATIEWEHLKRFEGLKEAMECLFKFMKYMNNREWRAMNGFLPKELPEE